MSPTARELAEKDRETQKSFLQFLQAEVQKHAATPFGEYDITEYVKQGEYIWAELLKTHRKLIGSVISGSDESKGYEEEHQTLLSQCMNVRRQFNAILATFPREQPGSPQIAERTTTRSQDIKLPRIELPKFDGNVLEWVSFRDQFLAIVHNSNLSNVQKLNYLQSSLSGDAEKVIGGLILTDSNYQIAFDLLKERYENEREIIFSLFQKLTSQAAIKESGSMLRGLIDTSKACIRGLEQFKVSICDEFLVFLITQKLDAESRKYWELSLTDSKIPKLKDVLEFMEQRARALSLTATTMTSSSSKSTPAVKSTGTSQVEAAPRKVTQVHHTDSKKCKHCAENHNIFKCPKFRALSVPERKLAVRQTGICINCLGDGHQAKNCSSKFTCHKCRGTHHTLLHEEKASASETSAVSHHITSTLKSQTLFATAIISIRNHHGNEQLCRVALDNFSSDCLILESSARRLGLMTKHSTTRIVGLGGASLGNSHSTTNFTFTSHFKSDLNQTVEALVVPKLVNDLPSFSFDPRSCAHFESLQLADPNFFRAGAVDILLGGDIFWNLILGEKKMGPPGTPIAVKSTLGWLIVGKVNAKAKEAVVHHVQSLDNLVERFWELESVPSTRMLTPEEQQCEEHFVKTHSRDSNGRFTVDLPFKQFPPPLGASRDIAVRRLAAVETRLEKTPAVKDSYHKFMQQYLDLGHMTKLQTSNRSDQNTCYIPHHFVLKDLNALSKFRVVFDASAKTSNGNSLNKCMMVGPTIQDSLVTLLIRFRTHRIGFTADIGKMYRQINVNSVHRPFQRIVWRFNPRSAVEDYQLNTVTYGTAAAPFLATRALHQLATDGSMEFPLASTVARNDFYVDDLMSGCDDDESAINTTNQLLQLTDQGGFQLLKWASNSQTLIQSIPMERRNTQSVLPITTEEDAVVSTLGLNWNTSSDNFTFKVKLPPEPHKFTKRTLLSEIARIFDPLGWCAPVIIKTKILFQELWKSNFGWDDQLVEPTTSEWKKLRASLQQLENLVIPRYVSSSLLTRQDLHGFCDASERAYAAAVYLRVQSEGKLPTIHLITAKTKVAPIKTVSLPRLELCGALLLSSLIKSVQESLHLKIEKITAWTDSTVTLEWIKSHPSRWKTFVGNRVTKIQAIIPADSWYHVPGKENPADCASRGITPEELINHPLWWHGPQWLQDASAGPTVLVPSLHPGNIPEEKKNRLVLHCCSEDDPFSKYSSLNRAKRIAGWCLRFITSLRHNVMQKVTTKDSIGSNLSIPPLTTTELGCALTSLIWKCQHEVFGAEIGRLRVNKVLPKKSRILSLNPFLDDKGLLRVGGRIRKSKESQDRKTPILLPCRHHFTSLIIRHFHLLNHHAGCQLLQSIICGNYWIINARDTIRYHIRKCVVCVRHRATTARQMMADLPKERVTPCRPFLRCGVDYAGPFQMKPNYGRSNATFKAYLCVFVCFSTRALHLEVVSSLSTDSFLAALRRFVSRRGKPTDIFSDQGSNFIGAARELQELMELLASEPHNHFLADELSKEGIQWHFNPASAPHFGGIWEAGVKSVKFHLVRVIGNERINFEEFTTITTQIEASLNSRPLTELSSDPQDFTCLTPGHFLIGGPLVAVAEPNLTEVKLNRLSRWQLLQQIQQHFWNRWSSEYLSRLQQRPKWALPQRDMAPGDLVLIKDERFPPNKWPLARIAEIHPGADGHVRVATLNTAHGEIKRPIVKLCPLPLSSSTTDEELSL